MKKKLMIILGNNFLHNRQLIYIKGGISFGVSFVIIPVYQYTNEIKTCVLDLLLGIEL